MNPTESNKFITPLIFLTGGFILAVVFSQLIGKTDLLGSSSVFVIIIDLVVAVFLALLVHESGHLIAGKISGFRLLFLIVGPMKIFRNENKLKFAINKDVSFYGGMTACVPDTYQNINKRMMYYVLGGPAASLFFGIIFLIAAYYNFFPIFMVITGIVSLFVAVISLVPGSVSGYATDGSNFVIYFRDGNQAKASLKLNIISALSLSGVRPKDWNKNDLIFIYNNCSNISDKTMALLMTYYHELDGGNVSSACQTLKKISEDMERLPQLLKGLISAELVYYYSILSPIEIEARKYFPEISRIKFPLSTATPKRAEAAFAFLLNYYTEAVRLTEEGTLIANQSPDKGMGEMEKDLLLALQNAAKLHISRKI